jgi:hypothetical protein
MNDCRPFEHSSGVLFVRLFVVGDDDERGRERCGDHPTKDNSASPDREYE